MPPKSIAAYFKPANGAAANGTVTNGVTAAGAAARRKAIADALEAAPPAKKTKTTVSKAKGVATSKYRYLCCASETYLTRPGASQSPTISIPKATTRDELRKSLESHPKVLSLLELELNTLGEDWLIALQDELTKPYFLKVCLHPSCRAWKLWNPRGGRESF